MVQERKVVGTVALDELSPTEGELRRMTVASSARRMGIATRLLRTVEKFAQDKQYTTIVLGTTSAQGAAIDFYQSSDYLLDEEIPMVGRFPGSSSFGQILIYKKELEIKTE